MDADLMDAATGYLSDENDLEKLHSILKQEQIARVVTESIEYLEGMTTGEIASLLEGNSHSSVEKRFQKHVEQLGRQLRKREQKESAIPQIGPAGVFRQG